MCKLIPIHFDYCPWTACWFSVQTEGAQFHKTSSVYLIRNALFKLLVIRWFFMTLRFWIHVFQPIGLESFYCLHCTSRHGSFLAMQLTWIDDKSLWDSRKIKFRELPTFGRKPCCRWESKNEADTQLRSNRTHMNNPAVQGNCGLLYTRTSSTSLYLGFTV